MGSGRKKQPKAATGRRHNKAQARTPLKAKGRRANTAAGGVATLRCTKCKKDYDGERAYARHKLLCNPEQVYDCPDDRCGYATGRMDVLLLHLAGTHDFYLDGDTKVRTTNRAHLNKKTIPALVRAYRRDMTRLKAVQAEYAQWDAARRRFGMVDDLQPRIDLRRPLPAIDLGELKKPELINELIKLRCTLFGSDYGHVLNWNATDEVASLKHHVLA